MSEGYNDFTSKEQQEALEANQEILLESQKALRHSLEIIDKFTSTSTGSGTTKENIVKVDGKKYIVSKNKDGETEVSNVKTKGRTKINRIFSLKPLTSFSIILFLAVVTGYGYVRGLNGIDYFKKDIVERFKKKLEYVDGGDQDDVVKSGDDVYIISSLGTKNYTTPPKKTIDKPKTPNKPKTPDKTKKPAHKVVKFQETLWHTLTLEGLATSENIIEVIKYNKKWNPDFQKVETGINNSDVFVPSYIKKK